MRSATFFRILAATRTVRHAAVALLLVCPAWAYASSYADRAEVRVFISEMSTRHGFDPDVLTDLFRRTRFMPGVVKAILPPSSPSVRSWHSYRARYLDTNRIEGGARFWRRHADVLARIEAEFGVPAEIIVAIIGVETIYGRMTGNFQALSALSTLAFDYPPRASLFRRELAELLLLAREMNRSPLNFNGSYAGALGIPQFLPSSYRRHGIDYDGDGKVDLFTSEVDAMASVANFLSGHGWVAGGVVTLPASVSGTAHLELADGSVEPRYTGTDLADHGISASSTGPDADERCALIDLATPDAPTEYWLGFRNFYVLTRYNRSSFYAMAVYQLSRELRANRDATEARLRRGNGMENTRIE